MKLLTQPMQEEINIPVFLAFEIMKRGLLPPFKLYIFLKCHSNGILKDNRTFVSSLSTHLQCSRNTVKEWLEILKSLNWIGFDPKNKIYYIRSFKSVCRIEDVRAKRGVIFYTSDFKKFKGFMYALPYAHIRDLNIKRNRGRAASLWGDASQPARNSLQYIPISIKLVSNYTGFKPSKIYYLRKIAENCGYLKVISNIKPLPKINPIHFRQINQYDNSFFLSNVFYNKGCIYIRKPDLIFSPLWFRKR